MTADASILAAIDDQGVLRVALNRPDKRNALDLATLKALRETFDKHAANARVKCAVLRGAGDIAFCAGGDLKEFGALRTRTEAARMAAAGRAALDSIRFFPAPVIAFINGAALGGGAELALACDMRFAAASAKIGFIHARLAITSAWGGSADLMELAGPSRAMALIARAGLVGADDARAMGLADGCAAPGEDAAAAFEGFLAPILDAPARLLRAVKKLASRRRRLIHDALRDLETENHIASWVHEDHWRAVKRLYGDRHEQRAAGAGAAAAADRDLKHKERKGDQ